MARDLIKQGGPHRVKKTGDEQYEFSISIPTDEQGFIGRECVNTSCTPTYFKVKLGTGVTDGQEVAYCPYCRKEAEPNDFASSSQVEYGQDIMEGELIKSVDGMIKDALDLDHRGKRKFGSGMFSMTMEMEPTKLPKVRRPVEEELRRDLTCPKCTLDHAVFGLATWCPDCGEDIFPVHVSEELDVLRKVLGEVGDRRERLGSRVAAKDIENTLEDLVSLFEAVLKILTRRHLESAGWDEDRVDEFFRRKVRTSYQNLDRAADRFEEGTAFNLRGGLSAEDFERLSETLKKRHPITHNLGIVDRQYLERARAGGLVGRDVRVTEEEVRWAIDAVETLLGNAHENLFGEEPEEE